MELTEKQKAMEYLSSTIIKCEKMQGKFVEGSSQHSLLKNRIHALKLSLTLMKNENEDTFYGLESLNKALPPIISIINKTSKAQSKYEAHTKQYHRFTPILEAMQIAQVYVENQIQKEIENDAI